MDTQRQSDENQNPEVPQIQLQVVENRRLSAQERRKKTMFEKSGMKKGALFKYLLTKKNADPEDSNGSSTGQPQSTSSTARVMTSNNSNVIATPPDSDDNSNELPDMPITGQINHKNDIGEKDIGEEGNDPLQNLSQDSSIIFEGEYDPKSNRNYEVVDVHSDEEDEPAPCTSGNGNINILQNDGIQLEEESPVASDEYMADEVPPDLSPETRPDYSLSHSNEDEISNVSAEYQTDATLHLPLSEIESAKSKVENWIDRMTMKRTHSREEDQPTAGSSSSFQPTASKTSRQSTSPIKNAVIGEKTPAKSFSSNSCMQAPIKIGRVYSINENSSSSNDAMTSTSSATKNTKKDIFKYKETNNLEVSSFIKKGNWKKMLAVMNVDFARNEIPKPVSVSVLIRKAILCDETRVAKQVQSSSVEFLQKLVEEYPPVSGNCQSIEYYKKILENVFDEAEQQKDVTGLFQFLTEISTRAEKDIKSQLETNTLWLLIFVTDLVAQQFREHNTETVRVKIKPPLLRQFMEDRGNNYCYEPACSKIVVKLFTADSPEMRCIFMKWLDLIAMSLRSLSVRSPYHYRKEYHKLVSGVAESCKSRADMGLFPFLNLECKEFSCHVCEKLFELCNLTPLPTIPNNGDGYMNDEDKKEATIKNRNQYLALLADTVLIKPALGIISDTCEETCSTNEKLTFVRTRMECQRDGPKFGDSKRKNVRGETRLHTLCNSINLENQMDEIRKHVRANPEDINLPDNYGNTPLHDCAANNKGDILQELMHLYVYENNPVYPVNFEIRNKSLETALHLAAVDCNSQNVDTLTKFAKKCGVLEDVLIAPNGDGKLPFEVGSNKPTINLLKPKGYSVDSKSLNKKGILLSTETVNQIAANFALRKIIAWWQKNKSSSPS